jgi:protein TonB
MSTPRKGSGSPRITIGSAVQASKLISKVEPVYPPQARAAGIEGTVTLGVTIGEDGHVESVDPKEGHPLLAAAAADAVRQWVYQPTLLNGTPCAVVTTVTLTFP